MKQLYALPVIVGLLAGTAALPTLAIRAEAQGTAAAAAPRGTEPQGPGGRRAFSAADANQDGFIDRAEWAQQRDLIFQRLDADRDGKLSREEMQRGRPQGVAPQRPRPQAASSAGNRPDRFSRLDTDGDGFVSRAEFNAASDQIFARCDKDGDGRIARGECRPASGQRAAAARPRRNDPPAQ